MELVKRLGRETSTTRDALVEAATQIIGEGGYAAATSRNVASRAGLKPQLIHYYFDTMDDLLLEALRRAADKALERLRAARDSSHPLRAIWEATSDRHGTKLMMEFKVMANHNTTIRAEMIQYAARYRQVQIEGIEKQLRQGNVKTRMDPLLVSVLLTSLARNLVDESEVGFTFGHAEAERFVKMCLSDCEKAEATPGATTKKPLPERKVRSKSAAPR